MGKGDKKTKRGKIVNGSYGRIRRRKKLSVKYEKPVVAEAPKVEKVEVVEEKPRVKKPVAKKTPVKNTTTAAKSEEKIAKKPAAVKTVANPKKAEAVKAKDKTEA